MDPAYLEQVLRLVEAVPAGSVTTYGDLAAMVGRGGPRQVGTVLARHGAGVPWWRVVRADGRPAEGLAPRALRHLLDENVPVLDGRVRLPGARWRPGAEELAEHLLPDGSEPGDGGAVPRRDVPADVPNAGNSVPG